MFLFLLFLLTILDLANYSCSILNLINYVLIPLFTIPQRLYRVAVLPHVLHRPGAVATTRRWPQLLPCCCWLCCPSRCSRRAPVLPPLAPTQDVVQRSPICGSPQGPSTAGRDGSTTRSDPMPRRQAPQEVINDALTIARQHSEFVRPFFDEKNAEEDTAATTGDE